MAAVSVMGKKIAKLLICAVTAVAKEAMHKALSSLGSWKIHREKLQAASVA